MSTFRLITGGIGTGKSLWTVDQLFILKDQQPDRKIYTDITGIRHTGIISVDQDFDWRDAEDNSLIVFDEVQYKDLFSRHNSKRDKQILDLTTIRKRGIELWVITQRARFLNPDVLGLVNEHIHLEKKSKKSAKVFYFQEAETTITALKKKFAFKKYVFQYPEHLYGFYDSIKDGAVHHQRSWMHQGIIMIVITLVIAFIAIGITIYNGTKKGLSATGVEAPKPKDIKSVQDSKLDTTQQKQHTSVIPSSDLSVECRKGSNIDKPECIKWFDDLTKNNQSIDKNGIQSVSYNPNKPYDQKEIQETVKYQVTSKPIFSGCLKKNGRYVAYSEQGTLLDDVSQDDCKRLVENGERPYNYFVQKDNIQNQPQQAPVEQKIAWTPEQIEKLMIAREQGLI